MNSLPIALLLPISGIVVTAVLVAVSRKKKASSTKGKAEIDMSWLDEFELKERQGKKAKANGGKAKKGGKKSAAKSTMASSVTKPADMVVASSAVSSSEDESEDDQHDDIALLAAIQGKMPIKALQKSTKSAKTATTAETIPSATTQSHPDANTDADEEGWNKVPTKDELVISSLRSRLDALAKSLETAESSRGTAEKNLAQALDKAARLEADLKERSSMFQLRLGSLESEINGHRSHAHQLSKRLAAVEEHELAEAKEEISRLSTEVYASESKIAEIAKDRQSLLDQLKGAEDKACQQSEEMARLRESIESLQGFKSKFHGLEAELANVQTALYTTESDLISLRSQEASRAAENKTTIEEKTAMVQSLEKEISAQAESLSQASATEATLKAQIEELSARLAELEQAKSVLAKQLEDQTASDKTLELSAQITKLSSEIESLKTSFEQAQTETEQAKAKITEQEASMAALKSEMASVETAKVALEAKISEMEATHKADEETINKLRADLSDAQSAAVSQQDLEAARAELAAVKKRFVEHLEATAGLKTSKTQLEQANLKLSNELFALKAVVFGGVKIPLPPQNKAENAPAVAPLVFEPFPAPSPANR